jgi:hypothetical protein
VGKGTAGVLQPDHLFCNQKRYPVLYHIWHWRWIFNSNEQVVDEMYTVWLLDNILYEKLSQRLGEVVMM